MGKVVRGGVVADDSANLLTNLDMFPDTSGHP
jgi:hypothetical protein